MYQQTTSTSFIHSQTTSTSFIHSLIYLFIYLSIYLFIYVVLFLFTFIYVIPGEAGSEGVHFDKICKEVGDVIMLTQGDRGATLEIRLDEPKVEVVAE